ncbi:MAG: recombination-associated protein RdgC [Pseudomonadota bacterium]
MGLINASGSFTRYLVEGPIPEDYPEEFAKRIARYAFRYLDDSSQDERSVGWVSILDTLDSSFPGREYFKEPYLALSWRVDRRGVPSQALNQHCRESERKIKEAESLEYLPRARRQEIREIVKARLLSRAIPRTQCYDMIWNLQTGVLIFGATGSKLCDEFAEFFFSCFDLHLKSIFPHFLASQVLEREGMAPDLLDGLEFSITGRTK